MTMTNAWWIACGILIAVELCTGTFYLLMLALGCAAGAGAAHLGLGGEQQVLTAAVVGGAAVAACYFARRNGHQTLPAGANADVNMDIGQSVDVESWHSDGSARVKYRGAAWQARCLSSSTPAPGRYVIRAVEGSCLLLDH
ncbi:NfeD family protein [Paucibacter sp. B2R-40]|uniref:NfeD family protein n=1 Tax=Paucibacter sp. B2R-40 TaxID=2893554 RepID=UPI0021E4C8E5|nr:NfeD family protein [Paucibacter sp. B2R-40]MCV2355801.1 NfeD family protein [Paucibacter sp. B2R-40]